MTADATAIIAGLTFWMSYAVAMIGPWYDANHTQRSCSEIIQSMNEGNFLPIKEVIGDISLRLLEIVHSAQIGRNFNIDIEVCNSGSNVLAWDQQHPINLSYRWFDMDTGAPLVLEGQRVFFRDFLRPHTAQIIHLSVTPPPFCGMATLRISCVCEGRFWFYEQFATGWLDLGINIVDPYPWPAPLRGSVASRALRGGVAAHLLRTSLAAAPIHCLRPLSIEEAAPELAALPVDEEKQDEFRFRPAPAEALSARPSDAGHPGPPEVVTVAEIDGWRSWLRHPFATFKQYLDNALIKSSLGQRLEASQRATEELLERLGQSAENELHTQFMLRQMNSYHERRDAYYAENQHAHIDILLREMSRLFHENSQHLCKVVTDGFQANEAASAKLFEQQQALRGVLQSIIDASRRLQLSQLRGQEDLKSVGDWQTGMTARFDVARQHQLAALSELREVVLLCASDTLKALETGFDDHASTFSNVMTGLREGLGTRLDKQDKALDHAIAQLPPLKEAVVGSVHDARQALEARLKDHDINLGDAIADLAARYQQGEEQVCATLMDLESGLQEATAASLNGLREELGTRLDKQDKALDHAIAQLPPLKEAVVGSVHDARQVLEARLKDHDINLGGAIANLAARYQQGEEQVRATLMGLESGQNRDAADREHLTGGIAGVRDFLHTNLPYMFAKVDALLHRQVFPATGSGKIICRNAKGLFAIPERDLEALAYYTAGQLPEAGSLAVVERLLQPGDTFVDVGANVGLFSVVAGRRIGSKGKVLSFEPVPETMSALASTVQLNGLGSIVSMYQSAAGQETGTAKLYVGRTCGHSSLLPLDESRETIEVPVVVLDDVIGSQKVDLIKIDVEGWELEVLDGLRNTLANNPQASVLLEFGPSHLQRAGTNVSTWISTLQALGMSIFEIDEDRASLTPLRSQGLEDIVSINLLLSRKPKLI